MTDYAAEHVWTEEFLDTVQAAANAEIVGAEQILTATESKDYSAFIEAYGTYADALEAEGYDISSAEAALEGEDVPDPSEYGIWVPGIPGLLESGLNAVHCAWWLQDLILNGIVGGVGAVLGFIPAPISL